MMLRIRDVEIAEKYMGATFRLKGHDREECFEGVDSFKYLGCVLHWLDEDWPAVCWNIGRARQFWGRLGKLVRR